MKVHYDYLIVGSGLYGATFAYMAHLQAGSVWSSTAASRRAATWRADAWRESTSTTVRYRNCSIR